MSEMFHLKKPEKKDNLGYRKKVSKLLEEIGFKKKFNFMPRGPFTHIKRYFHEIDMLHEYYEKLSELLKGNKIKLKFVDSSFDSLLLDMKEIIIEANPVKISKNYVIVSVNFGKTLRFFYIPNNKNHGARILLADARRAHNMSNIIMPFNVGHAVTEINDNSVRIFEIQGGFSSAYDKKYQNIISRDLTTVHSMWKRKLLASVFDFAASQGKNIEMYSGEYHEIKLRNIVPDFDVARYNALIEQVCSEMHLHFEKDHEKYIIHK